MKLRPLLVAAVIASCALSASATTESDLLDTWIRFAPASYRDGMLGTITWQSVTFSTDRAVSWTWERDGKTESHSGTYHLQPEPDSKEQFKKNTTVAINPTTLAVTKPILLSDVQVDMDNRFLATWTVLKCKDSRGNGMVFLRKKHHDQRGVSR